MSPSLCGITSKTSPRKHSLSTTLSLAILGGISLIVNKPYHPTKVDPLKAFNTQTDQLLSKCLTDFIQLAMLHQDYLPGINYYQCDLLPQYAPYICPDPSALIPKLPAEAVVLCHMQQAAEKDLQITSPFRQNQINARIAQTDLVLADGVAGQYDSDDEIPNPQNDHQVQQQIEFLSDASSPIKEIIQHYQNPTLNQKIEPFSPVLTEAVFTQKSKQVTAYSEVQLISRAELISYPDERQQQHQQQQPQQPQPTMEQSYRFPVQDQEGSQSPSNSDSFSPQMSIQSSESSSPSSFHVMTNRNRNRSNTTQNLLQRRQSKTGFALVLHHADEKHGSGDDLLQNYSESRPRRQRQQSQFNKDYLCFLAFRPATWERFAIKTIQKVVKQSPQCKLILQGYSSAYALVQIRKLLSPRIFSDISYPHLMLDSENIEDGQTQFKAEPPIRQKANKHLLQKAVCQQGWISSVSSQHLYINSLYKFTEEGDFRRAMSGICSLGCTFPALWSVLFCRRSIEHRIVKKVFEAKDLNDFNYKRFLSKLVQLQDLLSKGPANALGLRDRGEIEVGKVADFVVFQPFKTWKFDLSQYEVEFAFAQNRHILQEKAFLGRVQYVIIGGEVVLDKKKIYKRQGKQLK